MSNPFPSLQAALRQTVYPEHGAYFSPLVTALYVIHGILILVNLLTIVIKWYTGKLWMFRVHTTSRGRLKALVPNPVLGYILFSTIYYAFAIYLCYRTYLSGVQGSNLEDYVAWVQMIWIPMSIAGFTWCWSQSINYALSPKGITGNASGFWYLLTSPSIVTGFYIGIIISTTIAKIVLSIFANNSFNHLYEIFKIMDGLLTQASQEVVNGAIPDLTAYTRQQALFEVVFEEFTNRWIRAWICWLVVNLLIIVVFIPSVYLQWSHLHNSIEDLRRGNSATSATTIENPNMPKLIWNFRSLTFLSVIIALMLLAFVAFEIPLIYRTTAKRAEQGQELGIILRFSILYVTAILGGTISVVLFILSFVTYTGIASRSHQPSSIVRRSHLHSFKLSSNPPSLMDGIEVRVDVQLQEMDAAAELQRVSSLDKRVMGDTPSIQSI